MPKPASCTSSRTATPRPQNHLLPDEPQSGTHTYHTSERGSGQGDRRAGR